MYRHSHFSGWRYLGDLILSLKQDSFRVLKARSSDSSTSNTVLRERTMWKQRARRRTVLRERKLFVHLCSPFYTSVFGLCTFNLTILEENFRPSISCPPPSVFDSHPDLIQTFTGYPSTRSAFSFNHWHTKAKVGSSHCYTAASKRLLTSSFISTPYRSCEVNQLQKQDDAYLNLISPWSSTQSWGPGEMQKWVYAQNDRSAENFS